MLEFARHTPVERRILEMAGHIERERLTSEGSVTVVGVGLLRLLSKWITPTVGTARLIERIYQPGHDRPSRDRLGRVGHAGLVRSGQPTA